MIEYVPKYKQYGSHAILIEFPAVLSEDILSRIQLFSRKIELEKIEAIIEVNFVFNSILVIYDNKKSNFSTLTDALRQHYDSINFNQKLDFNSYQIPVCYEGDFDPDLDFLSMELEMKRSKIITLHTSVEYIVYGCGFLPGFLYLGGLHEKLHMPRRKTPRLKVPKGAVGIGGKQTGIYPQESPGGWHLIGNTPIELFNPYQNPPGFINPGDRLRFRSVDRDEHADIAAQIRDKSFNFNTLKL